MKLELSAKYEGDLASKHKLPAYKGGQSILGEAHASLIILNYAVEGKVRRRRFSQSSFKFNLVAQKPGSFDSVFEFIAQPENIMLAKSLGLGITGGVIANFLYELIKDTKQRIVGGQTSEQIDELLRQGKIKQSDLDKLTEAVEPATRQTHEVINYGADNINITVNGHGNVVNFDSSTKNYVWSKVIDNTIRAKIFNFSNYDGNHGGGRVFDFDEGRLISFDTADDVDRESIDCINYSLSRYSVRKFEDLNSAVAARYTSLHAPDGRLKKIRILKVRKEIALL